MGKQWDTVLAEGETYAPSLETYHVNLPHILSTNARFLAEQMLVYRYTLGHKQLVSPNGRWLFEF